MRQSQGCCNPTFPQLALASPASAFLGQWKFSKPSVSIASQNSRPNQARFRLQKLTHFPLQQTPVLGSAAATKNGRHNQADAKSQPTNQPAT
jgi:hypothetical protein